MDKRKGITLMHYFCYTLFLCCFCRIDLKSWNGRLKRNLNTGDAPSKNLIDRRSRWHFFSI